MRERVGSSGWKAWMKVCADIRAQNSDKSEEEIAQIIRVVRAEFSPNWKTYKYVKF